MPLEINLNAGNEPMVDATEKLWLTADKGQLVPDGDERAAILFCIPGQKVSRADAQRYGMLRAADEDTEPVPAEAPTPETPEAEQPTDEPEEKQAEAPANKQRQAPQNKRR